MSGSSSNNVNSVFYAETYHPIQAGSIDGTDTLPHDNAVYRALLCSQAGLYDPFGDPKVKGNPYSTIFVGHLSHLTTEESLRKAMSKYGKVKNLRLVRHIVTGASRGYAFVEFETEREMRRAYADAHHSLIDDSEVLVDYNRQQLMPGWIPRRLGGGLAGRKESGQLRFGGREKPFRAPLRSIPWDDLKRLGIPLPPEGRYMSRFQVPSPPRRKRSSVEREEHSHRRQKHVQFALLSISICPLQTKEIPESSIGKWQHFAQGKLHDDVSNYVITWQSALLNFICKTPVAFFLFCRTQEMLVCLITTEDRSLVYDFELATYQIRRNKQWAKSKRTSTNSFPGPVKGRQYMSGLA
ncbi:hypothetical protein RHMOL_Rhmol02G0084800 [Rhododendron molle]|uniref:Uncharacterized protein n=1 Tax=Rhododendron molle TaxID=49168 RepID=A0ACC0PPA8_RHOML|nr:hypothetical protein RHMOL_Rhmol02G0084800 [Rhododendron molle]